MRSEEPECFMLACSILCSLNGRRSPAGSCRRPLCQLPAGRCRRCNIEGILLARTGHQRGEQAVEQTTVRQARERGFALEGEATITQRRNRPVKVHRKLHRCLGATTEWNLQPTETSRAYRDIGFRQTVNGKL